jgi:hypothetical protein
MDTQERDHTQEHDPLNFDELPPMWLSRIGLTEYRIERFIFFLERIGRAIREGCRLTAAIGETLIGFAVASGAAALVIRSDTDLTEIIKGPASDPGGRVLLVGALITGVLLMAWGGRKTADWFRASAVRKRVAHWLQGIGGGLVLAFVLFAAIVGSNS